VKQEVLIDEKPARQFDKQRLNNLSQPRPW